MGNLQKVTKQAAASGILDEIERSPEEERRYDAEKHAIDYEKTYLNYSLTEHQEKATDYLNKRLSEVKVMKRDDVKVLGQWVWTMPKDLDEEYREKFFQGIYDFYAEKHGAENICYAQVHLDETTPHMHIGIIPIAKNKKGIDRVCAKEVFNKEYLSSAHADLQIFLEKRLGTEVNLINGQSLGIDGMREFKQAKELTKSLAELTEDVYYAQEELASVRNELREAKKELADVNAELNEKKGILTKLKDMIVGHPNMFEMFYHWIRKGQETPEERKSVVREYKEHVEEIERAAIRHSRDDGPSL